MKQQEMIHKVDWDILIIIDACRFDYFETFYKDVLGDIGELKMVNSPAAWTVGWLKTTFEKTALKDTILIWDHPVAERIRNLQRQIEHGKYFDVRAQFKKTIDMWELGYDKSLGYLPPDLTTNRVFKELKEDPEARLIAKYRQVHDPYLYYKGETKLPLSKPKYSSLRKVLYEIVSDEIVWTIRKKFNLLPESWLNAIWLKYGREGIIRGYTEDFKLMLNHAKKIVDSYPNKNIVITSDHGERLGEKGRYSHGGKLERIIKEVPWLEIRRR